MVIYLFFEDHVLYLCRTIVSLAMKGNMVIKNFKLVFNIQHKK